MAGELEAIAFSVCITGHRRWDGLDDATIEQTIGALLGSVEDALGQASDGECLALDHQPRLRFLSALAAGADQLGAKAALARPGWAVQAILPFGREAYARTMDGPDDAAARDWLLGDVARAIPTFEIDDWDWDEVGDLHGREWQRRRFVTLGQLLVQQADLVVAVWNGNPARGQGGTADVVAEAWRFGVPVAWIEPHSGRLLGIVPDPARRHEPVLQVAARLLADEPSGDSADPAIAYAVRSVRLGCDPARREAISAYRREPLPALFRFNETGSDGQPHAVEREGTTAALYNGCLRLLLPADLRPAAAVPARPVARPGQKRLGWLRAIPWWPTVIPFRTWWDAEIGRADGDAVSALARATAIDADLRGEAERADHIANRAGHVYRSGYIAIFLLAAAAVVGALSFLIRYDIKPWMVGLEVAALATAFFILQHHSQDGWSLAGVRLVSGKDYHNGLLEARMIGESLRAGRMLSWIGMGGRRALEPDNHGEDRGHGHGAERPVWTAHYVNAAMSLPGLPACILSRERIGTLATAAANLLDGQSRYHRTNRDRLGKPHHRLDQLSIAFVLIGFIAAVIYLAVFAIADPHSCPEHEGSPVVEIAHLLGAGCMIDFKALGCAAYHSVAGLSAFLGGTLPAAAAALTGIRYHGDFERFALRSRDTVRQLEPVIAQLRALAEEAVAGSPPYERLRALILQGQHILEDDVSDWQFAYAARPMPAP